MITTTTDIANRASRKIGCNKITVITSTKDKTAIIMNGLYDDTLRTVLCETNWMFATKRLELVRTTDSNVTIPWSKETFTNIYDVPSDFLRLVGWSEDNALVRQEGDYFLSDSNGGITKVTANESGCSAWSGTSVTYPVGMCVTNDSAVYYCILAHTSLASKEPGTSTGWETYWSLMTEEDTDGVWTLQIQKNLCILYLYYNTTIAQYPPYFIETLVDRLALDASFALAQSHQQTVLLEQRYQMTLSDAMAKNAMGQSHTSIKADAWINGRDLGANSLNTMGLYYR